MNIELIESTSTLLKSRRIEHDLELEDVSNILRIRAKYLKILEEEDFNTTDTPPPVYMLGYVKTYADFLGLNGQELINNIKSRHQVSAQLNLPTPYLDDNKPNFAIILTSVFLILFTFFVWQKIFNSKDIINNRSKGLFEFNKNEYDNNYHILKGEPSEITEINNLKLINFSNNNYGYNDKNQLILVATEDCTIKIANQKGKLIKEVSLTKGEIFLAPNEEGLIITLTNKNAVKLFDRDKLLNIKSTPA